MVLRHCVIFSSMIFLLNFRSTKFSRNCSDEVWSKISELTNPPRVHGDAMIIGTRYPSPIEPSRSLLSDIDGLVCWVLVAKSIFGSMPAETLPVFSLYGFGTV